MNRLTPEERRRVRLAQQRAEEHLLTEVTPPTQTVAGPAKQRWRRWMKAVAIAALLGGGGLLASQTLEFHPPASLMEALLPRP